MKNLFPPWDSTKFELRCGQAEQVNKLVGFAKPRLTRDANQEMFFDPGKRVRREGAHRVPIEQLLLDMSGFSGVIHVGPYSAVLGRGGDFQTYFINSRYFFEP